MLPVLALLIGLSSVVWSSAPTKCVPYNSFMVIICAEWEKAGKPSYPYPDPVPEADGSVLLGDMILSKEQWAAQKRDEELRRAAIEEGKYTEDKDGNIIFGYNKYSKNWWKNIVYAHYNLHPDEEDDDGNHAPAPRPYSG